MKTIIIGLLFAASACAEIQPKDFDRVVDAISQIESSNRPYVLGDNGKAYGLYQFHLARWCEMGGTAENFKKAPPAIQRRVMLNEINYVFKKKGNVEFVRALGTYHNSGGIKNIETLYVVKLRKLLF